MENGRRYCEYSVVVGTVSGREYYGNPRKYEIGTYPRDTTFDKDQVNLANAIHRGGEYTLHMEDGTQRRFNMRNVEWLELRLTRSAADVSP